MGDRAEILAESLIAKIEPQSLAEAEAVIQEIKNIGFDEGNQGGLFGDEQIAESVILERAGIKTAALRQLKRDRVTFNSTFAIRPEGPFRVTFGLSAPPS